MPSAGSLAAILLLGATIGLGAAAPGATPGPRALAWWQRGQDTWYYKDDWKGLFLTGAKTYRKTVELAEAPTAAYAYVWSGAPYVLKVNGQAVGADADDGTIEDYDLAPHLGAGRNTIEIESGGEVNCEGAAILADGRQVDFATDASWGGPGTQTSKERKTGPHGYLGDTHMARILTVTPEQKAKALVNWLASARRRILDRDRYNFWKARDPCEVLTLDKPTEPREAWAGIEKRLEESLEPIAQAAALVHEGKFAEVKKAAQPALEKTKAAEEALADLMKQLGGAAAARQKLLEGDQEVPEGVRVSYNRSACNRLGWVASTEPLDNDPAWWEFDVAPPGAPSIALAGWWRFALDPQDEGLKGGYARPDFDDAAWQPLYAPTKWGWERWGYVQCNENVKGWNKPYNGLAWYRKALPVPADWKGQDLVLCLGPRWGNVDWLAVNGEFVSAPDKPGSNADTITIPARLVKFGEKNTLALRVMNADNIGGIINRGLRLSAAATEPRVRRHIVGPGSAREVVFRTPGGPVTQVVYSSALSPAAVVASSAKAIRLGGWQARGFQEPARLTFVGEHGVEDVPLPGATDGSAAGVPSTGGQATSGTQQPTARPDTPAVAHVARQMRENWLLLWRPEEGVYTARPLLVVLEKRPEEVALVDDGFGGRALELRFAQAGARVVLVRPFDRHVGDELDPTEIDRARLWSRALLKYPVGYREELAFDGACRATLTYEYLELEDDWKTKPESLAPLPMLFSYALENRWPGARIEGNEKEVVNLGCKANSLCYIRSDCGTYRAAVGKSDVSYAFDRREPRIHFRGAGTFGEERRIGDPMFEQMQKWGFNVVRPQIGIPAATAYEKPAQVAGFDAMLESSKKHNLTCFVNWFTDQVVPEDRRKDFVDRWVAMAEHGRDLPENLIVYDFINEPAGVRWDDYSAFMKKVTEAVRAVDKRHWLSVEFGGGWAQPEDADMTEPTGDANTIYQFHFYGPHTDDVHRFDLWYPRYKTDEERFESYEGWEERMLSPVRFMIRTGREVMHGEFGLSFLGPDEAPRGWLQDVLAIHEKYRMHWSWWNYSGTDINRTGLVAGERVNPLLETLQEYAKMKPPTKKAKAAGIAEPGTADDEGEANDKAKPDDMGNGEK